MSDETPRKEHGMLDQAREMSGIYKLGFERESFIGISLPFIIVIGVGGLLGVLIWQFL
jgi:hypothetical protein